MARIFSKCFYLWQKNHAVRLLYHGDELSKQADIRPTMTVALIYFLTLEHTTGRRDDGTRNINRP